MEQPLLSICIPTYKRADILRKTLKSIYYQDVDHNLFEVCISDDSPDNETEKMIAAEFSSIDNLTYKKVPDCGFYNLINALKLGNGFFLKLQNDYAAFNEGTLDRLISVAKQHQDKKPVIFFGLGSVKNVSETTEYNSFDSFIKTIDINCTFCSSMSIWKDDFQKLNVEHLECNVAFPHTTLLFKQADKSHFLIDNNRYFTNAELKTKGGYNLPDYFVKEYTQMIKDDLLDKGYISQKTYDSLEDNALRFTAEWYWILKFDKRLTMKFDNYKETIKEACGENGYRKFEIYRRKAIFKRTVKKVAKSVLSPFLKKK